MKAVISLYDLTGEAVRPWAAAGYQCYIFDIQHTERVVRRVVSGGGSITRVRADLHKPDVLAEIVERWKGNVAFMSAFPVCTDLAVSGAAWFAKKACANPDFQLEAADHAKRCGDVGDALACPYYVENPVSRLSTLWRKPDHRFNPYEFGGYISKEEAEHPRWPDYIMPFDAYPKKTCLWTGGGFIMPDRKPVPVAEGYSVQHRKLGGKSQRTKDIRSATPRGFSRAVCIANIG